MYEHKRTRPISVAAFLRRLARHFLIGASIIVLSLAFGMVGYHVYESLDWTSAFLNSAMLLGGMGPVDAPRTEAGKLFAGFYALYAGLVFIVVASILVTPLLHRVLHLLSFEESKN